MKFFSTDSLISFLAHVGTGIGLIIIGLMAFSLTTRFSEWELIKAGNTAVP